MHRFYLTNNLGGGGTNVSRFYDYIELFDLKNIGVLLNYYYLTGNAIPKFDAPLIAKVSNYQDINAFVAYCRKYFSSKRTTSTSFVSKSNNSKIKGFILDNGCGNFLRNILGEKGSHSKIQALIKPFLDFADSLNFDLSVALDLAMKYTYKANEVDNPVSFSKWQELASDKEFNLQLLSEALDVIKSGSYNHKILAPLHGFDNASFSQYYDDVIRCENTHGAKFGGFALGGIAATKNLDNKLWEVPNGLKLNQKSAYLCYNLIKTIRKKTERHIHVLGAGNIYTLPFLIHAGADSSDCHSAWRRSSDGGIDKAKILIPLLDRDFNFINDKNCLEYEKIGSMKQNQYKFNCGLSVSEIQTLLKSSNKEDLYFGEIMMFYEAILQYDILIDFIDKHPLNYLNLLTKSPDNTLNQNYTAIISVLNL